MNKLALALIFSTIVFIKGTPTVNNYNTEPYHSFDWLDEDEQTFTIAYTSDTSTMPDFCYLFNSSVVCRPECSANGKTLSCKLVGDNCKADGDNPAYKYYYAVYCDNNHATNTNYTKNASPEQLLYYLVNTASPNGDVGVTIAVCSGSFLKYSLILLSLLIL